MKKYQKIIKDNIDLISDIEESLLYDIDHPEEMGGVIPEGNLRCIYVASGAIRIINSKYDFNQITEDIAGTIANMLVAYASHTSQSKVSTEQMTYCFELSRGIKENIHYQVNKRIKATF